MNMKKLGSFAAGVLFGTAGLKILGSEDAKKVYAHTTAAVLRAKDCVMKAPMPRTSTKSAHRRMPSLRTLPWRPLPPRQRNKAQTAAVSLPSAMARFLENRI